MPEQDAQDQQTPPQRIAKVMARAGLCSRRDAERWIEEGRVRVNGTLIKTPALTVTNQDEIVVDGTPLPRQEPPRLWRYHKPRGLVTTARDERGRPTVFDNLPQELPRVISIGRLDINSEGLLLLTNDGELARKLELPSTGWVRRYRVRVQGRFIEQENPDKLAKGITVEGVRYGPIKAHIETQQSSNAWLIVSLQEGKNREVRRVLEHLGYPVNRLIRISYGPFQLGTQAPGSVEEVSPRILREQLGQSSKTPAKKGQGGTAKAKPRPVKPGGQKGRPDSYRKKSTVNKTAWGKAVVDKSEAGKTRAGKTGAGKTGIAKRPSARRPHPSGARATGYSPKPTKPTKR